MKKFNWIKIIIAGLAGTVLFDLFGLMMGMGWWDIPILLGKKTELGLLYGVLGHFGNGVLLAILYAGIAPALWGPKWLRPFLFITVQTIALVWLFMMPLVGAGVAGLNMGVDMAIGSLVRHWIYAIPYVLIINKELFPKIE